MKQSHRNIVICFLMICIAIGFGIYRASLRFAETKVDSVNELSQAVGSDEEIGFGSSEDHPRSSRWPKARLAHLRTNPYCAACGDMDKLNVHHIVSFRVAPECELDPSNLITLCVEGPGKFNCHLHVGHGGNFRCRNPDVVKDARRLLNLRSTVKDSDYIREATKSRSRKLCDEPSIDATPDSGIIEPIPDPLFKQQEAANEQKTSRSVHRSSSR